MLLPGREEFGDVRCSSTLKLRLRDLCSCIFHAAEFSEGRSRTVLVLWALARRLLSKDGLWRLVSSEDREAEAEEGL
jgi:hypothetical protein